MARYGIINAAGTILNVIEWDGVTPYDPGTGLKLLPGADIPASYWISQTVPDTSGAVPPILPDPTPLDES
jgi:hypothetical protein